MSQRATETDAALFDRVRSGESACFDELVRRYQGPLFRVARSRLGRADWAEEVVQETFLAAFKSCASYDPRFNFRTWLWTILLNQCRGHYQRRMRSVPLEPSSDHGAAAAVENEEDPASSSPLVELLVKERAEQLELLLGQLSQAQSDAIRLRFFGGLKFQEISEAMQCSLNTAKNRVRWGLMRMAELIDTAGAGQSPRDEEDRER